MKPITDILTKDMVNALNYNKQLAEKVMTLVDQISSASFEQAQSAEQINSAVAGMDKVVQQTAANAQESASTVEELSSQAKQLNYLVRELSQLIYGKSKNFRSLSLK